MTTPLQCTGACLKAITDALKAITGTVKDLELRMDSIEEKMGLFGESTGESTGENKNETDTVERSEFVEKGEAEERRIRKGKKKKKLITSVFDEMNSYRPIHV